MGAAFPSVSVPGEARGRVLFSKCEYREEEVERFPMGLGAAVGLGAGVRGGEASCGCRVWFVEEFEDGGCRNAPVLCLVPVLCAECGEGARGAGSSGWAVLCCAVCALLAFAVAMSGQLHSAHAQSPSGVPGCCRTPRGAVPMAQRGAHGSQPPAPIQPWPDGCSCGTGTV